MYTWFYLMSVLICLSFKISSIEFSSLPMSCIILAICTAKLWGKCLRKDMWKCLWFFFFTFSYPCNVRESIVLDQIFEMEILMDWHVMRIPESENHIFTVWFVCMCVCVCLLSALLKKQIAAESSNLVVYICIIYRSYFKLFIKIEQKLCVEGHTKKFIQKSIKACRRNFL